LSQASHLNHSREAESLRLACSSFAVTVFLWYFFNAVFAIFNKRTLNVFPYPWLLSCVQVRGSACVRLPNHSPGSQLACGAAFMLLVWALRIYPAPKARRASRAALAG